MKLKLNAVKFNERIMVTAQGSIDCISPVPEPTETDWQAFYEPELRCVRIVRMYISPVRPAVDLLIPLERVNWMEPAKAPAEEKKK